MEAEERVPGTARVRERRGALCGVVAIDGPSGTGKSTVARRLAVALGAQYLDTGAMYRAAALGVLRAGVDPQQPAAVAEVVARARIEVGTDPAVPAVRLDGVDVAAEVRAAAATTAVSPVSAVPRVRQLLVAQQRELIAAAVAAGSGIVAEGRDIGEVVAPDAGLKVYLTASTGARAERRAAQDGTADVTEVRRAVERRDAFDSTRAASPLRIAPGAVEVDTTDLELPDVVARLHELVVERGLVPTGGPA